MLKTVKKAIADVSDINFLEFYAQYIMSVQDYNIEEELRFLLKYNTLEANTMQFLIQSTYERLGDVYDSYSQKFTDSL